MTCHFSSKISRPEKSLLKKLENTFGNEKFKNWEWVLQNNWEISLKMGNKKLKALKKRDSQKKRDSPKKKKVVEKKRHLKKWHWKKKVLERKRF